jgi:PHAX RNA-binding domain
MAETEAAYLTAEEIASLLEESNVWLISKAIWVIGGARVEALLEQTLHIEATGGMLTEDQSRRRTPGGTFFALMRDAVSGKERYRLFSVAPGTLQAPVAPCTWEDVQQAINELSTTAEEATMKLTMIGRPGATQTKGQTVIFQLKGKSPGNLPKELPPLPKDPPLTWTVIVGARQWNKVKASLDAHPDDRLVIDGYPTMLGDQLVLLADQLHQRHDGTSAKSGTTRPDGGRRQLTGKFRCGIIGLAIDTGRQQPGFWRHSARPVRGEAILPGRVFCVLGPMILISEHDAAVSAMALRRR